MNYYDGIISENYLKHDIKDIVWYGLDKYLIGENYPSNLQLNFKVDGVISDKPPALYFGKNGEFIESHYLLLMPEKHNPVNSNSEYNLASIDITQVHTESPRIYIKCSYINTDNLLIYKSECSSQTFKYFTDLKLILPEMPMCNYSIKLLTFI